MTYSTFSLLGIRLMPEILVVVSGPNRTELHKLRHS